MKRIILILALLAPALAMAFTFDCLPKLGPNGETGTNLRWLVVKNGPSWVKWDCPGNKSNWVAVDFWPFDFTSTVGMANTIGWEKVKALATWLPAAASAAPVAHASAASAK
jgi:hypothetical protein